jgi:hypothetical protein
MNGLSPHLHIPTGLAIEFIDVFSRIEYALKSTGYVLGNNNKVEPAWDRFANEIDDQFTQLDCEDINAAKSLLLSSPPRKQVLQKGEVIFQDQIMDQNQRSTQQVIRFVRMVRNNLSHGGKYLPNGEADTGRNEDLVNSSLKVLKACLELNEEVMESYSSLEKLK